jgi:hypothetical protein
MLSGMDKKKPKRPRDPNQLAALITGMATGEIDKDQEKDPAAVALGKKGGKARAKSLTPEQRKAIAKKAAKSRWKKD